MQIATSTTPYRLATAGELAQEVYDTLVNVLGCTPAHALREANAIAKVRRP